MVFSESVPLVPYISTGIKCALGVASMAIVAVGVQSYTRWAPFTRLHPTPDGNVFWVCGAANARLVYEESRYSNPLFLIPIEQSPYPGDTLQIRALDRALYEQMPSALTDCGCLTCWPSTSDAVDMVRSTPGYRSLLGIGYARFAFSDTEPLTEGSAHPINCTSKTKRLLCPLAYPLAATSAWPLISTIQHLRRRNRPKKGHCRPAVTICAPPRTGVRSAGQLPLDLQQ